MTEKRGRPQKYETEEERHEARKQQYRTYKKKVYEAEKEIKKAMSPEQKCLMSQLRKNVLTVEKTRELYKVLGIPWIFESQIESINEPKIEPIKEPKKEIVKEPKKEIIKEFHL
jgi:hypothetical protein